MHVVVVVGAIASMLLKVGDRDEGRFRIVFGPEMHHNDSKNLMERPNDAITKKLTACAVHNY